MAQRRASRVPVVRCPVACFPYRVPGQSGRRITDRQTSFPSAEPRRLGVRNQEAQRIGPLLAATGRGSYWGRVSRTALAADQPVDGVGERDDDQLTVGQLSEGGDRQAGVGEEHRRGAARRADGPYLAAAEVAVDVPAVQLRHGE